MSLWKCPRIPERLWVKQNATSTSFSGPQRPLYLKTAFFTGLVNPVQDTNLDSDFCQF